MKRIMKITDDLKGNITCKFNTKAEETLFFNLVSKHISLMPKVYRKRYPNWYIVGKLTSNGSGYSIAICRKLGVDPFGYLWIKQIKKESE